MSGCQTCGPMCKSRLLVSPCRRGSHRATRRRLHLPDLSPTTITGSTCERRMQPLRQFIWWTGLDSQTSCLCVLSVSPIVGRGKNQGNGEHGGNEQSPEHANHSRRGLRINEELMLRLSLSTDHPGQKAPVGDTDLRHHGISTIAPAKMHNPISRSLSDDQLWGRSTFL